MKWPWVSRALYDDAIRTVAQMREREVWNTTRYDNLFAEYAKLRLQGAVSVPDPIIPTPAKVREPDELKELIHEKCGSDYRKRAMMLRQLAVDRSAGVNEAQIRQAIEQGVQSEGVPA